MGGRPGTAPAGGLAVGGAVAQPGEIVFQPAGASAGWCGQVRKRTAAALTGSGGIIHCARLRAS